MNRRDRTAIEDLCDRLAEAARNAPPRDPEAERLIRDRLAGIPGAAYHMAQTIVVQEAALAETECRIAELEARLCERRESGGLLAGILGDGGPGRDRVRPCIDRHGLRPGTGFLGGAAQTAMGVAGGVLLANAISGMFAPDVQPLDMGEFDDLAGLDDFDI